MPLAKSEKENKASSDGCKTAGWMFGLILVLLVAILAAILWNGLIKSEAGMTAESGVWAAIIIMAVVFLLLLYLGCMADGTLDQGEMRRAIAGTFVLGFTMLIFFLAAYPVQNQEVLSAYLQMVGVIIGFYFGAKTALASSQSGKPPGDEATVTTGEAE